jgi:hypothetical protein
MPDFKVMTRGMPSRADEWLQTLNTPDAELPHLTEEDKHSARLRRMTDEQYARHLALRAYTRKREEREAEELGNAIIGILQEMGGEFRLLGLWKRGLEPGWRAQIQFRPEARGRVFDVPLLTEDFSDEPGKEVLDASNHEDIRSHLLAALRPGSDQRAAS